MCSWVQRLIILGEYGLSVTGGKVTILGATLSVSQTIYDVCATSSHLLPVIRCSSTDIDKAEICLHQRKSELRSLMQLSPLFAGLWGNSSGPVIASNSPKQQEFWRIKESSFQIVRLSAGTT
jgi:hypothetical protein